MEWSNMSGAFGSGITRVGGLPDRIRRILLDLGENGPATGYSLADRMEMHGSSAYDGLKIVYEMGFVERRVDPEWTGFLKKKEYSLTTRGFSAAVMLADPETLRQIPAAWPGLIPLVTGKWSLFEDIEDLALLHLKWGASYLASPQLVDTILWPHLSDPAPMTDEEKFTRQFYHPGIGIRKPEECLRWAAACAKDQDVRNYCEKRLKHEIEAYRLAAREAESMMQALQGEEER